MAYEVTDSAVLALLAVQTRPVAAAALAPQLGAQTQSIAAALSRLEDEGKVRAVASNGQPRGSSGTRMWVVT